MGTERRALPSSPWARQATRLLFWVAVVLAAVLLTVALFILERRQFPPSEEV